MTWLALTSAAVAAAMALAAWWRPLLWRLAVRNVARRRTDSLLVVAGCMLGTALITGSLAVGDTLEGSLRAQAANRIGPVDVVVRSFVQGTGDAIATTLALDPPSAADGVLSGTAVEGTVATLATPDEGDGERVVVPSSRLLEFDLAEAAAFGGDPGATGVAGGRLAEDRIGLSDDLAGQLRVAEGDEVEVFAYGRSRRLVVDRVLPSRGLVGLGAEGAGSAHTAFVAADTIRQLAFVPELPTNARAPEYLTLLSAEGGVMEGAERSDALEDQVRAALSDFPGHDIAPVKAELLDTAAEDAASYAELFVSLAAFAVLGGVALLVNVLVMLAEERRRELGVLRAVGMSRSALVTCCVLEGALYAAAAAAAGTVVGIGVARLIVALGGEVLSGIRLGGGVELNFGVQSDTLAVGFLAGLLVSLAVVLATSVATSRLPVIAAIRGEDRRRSVSAKAWSANPGGVSAKAWSANGGGVSPQRGGMMLGLGGCALVVSAGAVGSVAAGDQRSALLLPCLAVPLLTVLVLRLRGRSSGGIRRTVRTLAALAAMAWAVAAFPLLRLDDTDVALFVVQGLVLTLAGVGLAVDHAPLAAGGLRRVGGRAGLVLRLATASPGVHHLRTGATLLAYALVVFTLVLSSVISSFFSSQVDQLVVDEGAGFDLLVTTDSSSPVTADTLAAFSQSEAVASLAWTVADFRVLHDSAQREPFRDWALSGFDDAFLALGPPPLESWDTDVYPDEAAVWEAVRDDPRLAIADIAFLQRGGGPPEENVAVGETLAVREPGSDTEVERRVVAISSAGAAFSGVMVSRASLEAVAATEAANRHYVALPEGRDVGAAARDLERSFLVNGLEAQSFTALVDQALAGQEAFFDLIEGYLALGLLVGIAGLGVVAARTVREQRRPTAILRSLGVSPATVRAAVVVQAGLLALVGMLLGASLAVLTGAQLVAGSTVFGDTPGAFTVPWGQLAALLAAALIASVGAALPSAVRAAKDPPAAALRLAARE